MAGDPAAVAAGYEIPPDGLLGSLKR
jgi:hypothetical protein